MQSGWIVRNAHIGLIGLAGALALAIGLASPASAADFAGQRVTLIVPTKEGGGTDVYARAIGPFLAKHLPGKPRLVIRNIPGTGSVPGVNQFQRDAKPDGLTMIATTTSTMANYMLGNPTVEYELNTFVPVIVSPQGTFIYASPKAGANGPQDVASLRAKELLYAGYGATSAEVRQLFMFHQLGLKIKPVFGLSRGKARQAFKRGETQINNDSAASFIKKVTPMIEKGDAVALWSTGVLDERGNIVRDPVTPDLPSFTELYEKVNGKALEGAALEAWMTIFSFSVITNKGIHLPQGTPDDVVQAYRGAARNMLEDPEFQAFRKKNLGQYRQYIGEDAKAPLHTATNWSKEGRAYIVDFLKTQYDVDL